MHKYSSIYIHILLLLLFTKSLLHVSAQVIRFIPEDGAVCAETCSRHLINNNNNICVLKCMRAFSLSIAIPSACVQLLMTGTR